MLTDEFTCFTISWRHPQNIFNFQLENSIFICRPNEKVQRIVTSDAQKRMGINTLHLMT
jgi:hypothetical protein